MAIIDKVKAFVPMEENGGVRANAHTTGSAWDLSEQNSVPQIAGKVGFGARMTAGNLERLFNANNLYQPSLSFGIFIWVWNILGDGSAVRRPVTKTGGSNADRAYNVFTLGSLNELRFLLWYSTSGLFDTFTVDITGLHSDADPGWDLIFVGRSSDHKMLVRLNGGALQEKAIPRTIVNSSGNGAFSISEAAGSYASGDYDQLIFCDPCPTLAEMDEVWNAGAGVSYNDISAQPPAAPTALTATATAGTKIALAWVDNSDDEDGFKVEQSIDDNTAYAEIHVTAANVESYVVTGLIPGRRYFFRVKARNAEGDSGYTNEVSAVTHSGPVTSTFAQKFVTSTFTKKEVTSTFVQKKVLSTFTRK